jgi:hypothetical protein
VALDWNAVVDTTGYRVLRSSTRDGRFAVSADIDITTGVATAGDEVINIWSSAHSYIPSDGALGSPDPSGHFQYVEVGGGSERCFKVVAYNEDGEAPPSIVVCGSPP